MPRNTFGCCHISTATVTVGEEFTIKLLLLELSETLLKITSLPLHHRLAY